MTASNTERLQAWLSRGIELERALDAHGYWARNGIEVPADTVAATREALRELMASWVKTRDLILATHHAASFVRAAALWASDVFVVEVMHWALGPYRWCAP